MMQYGIRPGKIKFFMKMEIKLFISYLSPISNI